MQKYRWSRLLKLINNNFFFWVYKIGAGECPAPIFLMRLRALRKNFSFYVHSSPFHYGDPFL